MLVDDDSREVSSERDNENKGEVKTISVREESENRVYIDKRGRRIKSRDKRDKESKSENKSESKSGDKRNRDYISVRVRLCAATPASIIGNGTPPPPSQKHHFTHKHQINFCN